MHPLACRPPLCLPHPWPLPCRTPLPLPPRAATPPGTPNALANSSPSLEDELSASASKLALSKRSLSVVIKRPTKWSCRSSSEEEDNRSMSEESKWSSRSPIPSPAARSSSMRASHSCAFITQTGPAASSLRRLYHQKSKKFTETNLQWLAQCLCCCIAGNFRYIQISLFGSYEPFGITR